MRDDDLIERYLVALDAELRLESRARRRIVTEARDHLHYLVGDSDGNQSRAIDAFGAPGVVARRFSYELAIGATRRAARRGAAMFFSSLLLVDLSTSSLIHVAPGWLNDGPGSALLWIIGQVGLVAGAISLARARVARRQDPPDTIRLRYAVRGLIVLSICTMLTIGIAAAGIVTQDTTTGPRSLVLLAALTLACAAVTAISAATTWRASRRLVALDDLPVTATGREALLDLVAAARDGWAYAVRRLPLSSLVNLGIAPRWPPAGLRGLRAFDPWRHPWRYGVLIALLVGCAVPAVNLAVLMVTGQLDSAQLGQLAASTPALITIEAGLVLVGFAALGPYLGLRPSRADRSPQARS